MHRGSTEEYSDATIVKIEQVEPNEGDWLFCLVDFDDSDVGTVPIPLTFRG
jgi:hypothetical protein